MVVRDPNFWRRFSIAVHQDDAAKEEMTKRPDLKHSYVLSLPPFSRSPLASPTSQTHLSPGLPPMAHLPTSSPSSPAAPWPLSPAKPSRKPTTPPKRQRTHLQKTPSTRPLLRPTIATPPANPRQPSVSHLSPRRPSLPYLPFARSANSSTLSLSGRPHSHFKFWTTITADRSNRDSWLESQQKKRRQRTWICWVFWLVLATLIAGLVVTLLILKSKKII